MTFTLLMDVFLLKYVLLYVPDISHRSVQQMKTEGGGGGGVFVCFIKLETCYSTSSLAFTFTQAVGAPLVRFNALVMFLN